jgi:hypothetical protein
MDRREFLKKSIAVGIGAGAMLIPGGLKRITSPAFGACEFPNLVAVKGGSAGAMFDRGMKAIGGMDRFVRKGQ